MHEGYGTGIIILFIFTIASIAEFFFMNSFKKESHFDWRWLAVLACSILAMAIHPSGYRMITHPIEIYSQLNVNKYTTELVSFSDIRYWTFQAYLNVILFAITFSSLFLNYNRGKESRFLQLTNNFGWGYPFIGCIFYFEFNRKQKHSVFGNNLLLFSGCRFRTFYFCLFKEKKNYCRKRNGFCATVVHTKYFVLSFTLSIHSNQ